MTDDKRRPVEERIAALDVSGSFRDIRDGIGPGGPPDLTAQDIAAALGIVKSREGRLTVLVLETYYGSSLRHEQSLRSAWSDHHETADQTKAARILSRFSCAIAVRQFAGIKHVETDMAEYSYLMALRPAEFRRAVDDVLAWLEDYRASGLTALRKAVRNPRAVA